MGSLYSDEEEEVVEAPPEKVQMTWTRERCEAERRNRNNAPENFRELMSLKPWVRFRLLIAPAKPFTLFSHSLCVCTRHGESLLRESPIKFLISANQFHTVFLSPHPPLAALQGSVQCEANAHGCEAERGHSQQIAWRSISAAQHAGAAAQHGRRWELYPLPV